MDEQKLRELCISYAMSLILESINRGRAVSLTPIHIADKIYQYIKSGEKYDKIENEI